MVDYKNVTITKRDSAMPIAQLVLGDRNSTGVRFHISRYDGGVDLSTLGWSVKVENAQNDTDVCIIYPTITDSWIVADWVLPAICAGAIGETAIEIEGVGDDGQKVWQSGKRFIRVNDDLDAEPGYVPEDVTQLQKDIETATVKVRELRERVGEADGEVSEAIRATNKAAENATRSATNAEAIISEIRRAWGSGEFDGYSPTVSVSKVGKVATITIRDKNGDHRFEISDGEDGGGAEITAAIIAQALGYTPADKTAVDQHTTKITKIENDVSQNNESIADLQNGKQDKIEDIESIRSKANSALQSVPVATDTVQGVVKINSWNGTSMMSDGSIRVHPASTSNIDNRNSHTAIVVDNFDYAIKASLTDGKAPEYTDTEKAAACETIGAVETPLHHIIEDFEHKGETITVVIDTPTPIKYFRVGYEGAGQYTGSKYVNLINKSTGDIVEESYASITTTYNIAGYFGDLTHTPYVMFTGRTNSIASATLTGTFGRNSLIMKRDVQIIDRIRFVLTGLGDKAHVEVWY